MKKTLPILFLCIVLLLSGCQSQTDPQTPTDAPIITTTVQPSAATVATTSVMLAQKTNADMLAEKRYMEAELQKAISRSEKVVLLYEKLYEDNAIGKVTDEWFMQMSHKYEVERMELKAKIADLRDKLDSLGRMTQNKDRFINAIRKFVEMEQLTAPLLRELIDKIMVYETEGVGKNRSQRIVIHYKFVGIIEIPECGRRYTADTRKGVAVSYVTHSA